MKNVKFLNIEILKRQKTVSYTHLDVYKRQTIVWLTHTMRMEQRRIPRKNSRVEISRYDLEIKAKDEIDRRYIHDLRNIWRRRQRRVCNERAESRKLSKRLNSILGCKARRRQRKRALYHIFSTIILLR